MARMMPAYRPEAAPPGEKAIYAALASSSDTSGWIVLHSLAIANHIRQVEGEADFVIVVPERGILVVEVKSHKTVERSSNGLWKLGNDEPKARGPFQQAREAMHSVRKYLLRRSIDLRSIPVLDAVWFTEVRARTMLPSSPEWHGWQVLDSEDLRSGAAGAILRTFAAGTAHLNRKIFSFSRNGAGPDTAVAERIASVLRPRFEIAVAGGDRRRTREGQLLAFIDEQYAALDAMQENRAVLFTGSAGSGKTLLALEAARREILIGNTGRLLCFNRLLGRRLANDSRLAFGLRVGTFHQELLRIARVQPPPGAGPVFWERELPDRAIEKLLFSGEEHLSSFLVIDEMQDVATEPFLDVLGLMVHGGLEGGRLLLFGDFEHQAIFDVADGYELLKHRIPRLSLHRLTINCRNLPRIGYQVNTVSKLEPGYGRFRRPDDGVDPTFVSYRVGTDQSIHLLNSIRTLRSEGYELNEIAVLSPLDSESTANVTSDPWLRQVLRPANGSASRPGQIAFSTIHSFKGLEAPAVVVTDLDQTRVPNFDSLLYIGLTRATDRLFAVMENGSLRSVLGGIV